MTNKEREAYFYHNAKNFSEAANHLITMFMTNKKRYGETNHRKYWLILMGLQETAYIVCELKND